MAGKLSKNVYSKHVADKGRELIEVIVHYGQNIPNSKDDKIPNTFVTALVKLSTFKP